MDILNEAYENGVNLDKADVYGNGRSENNWKISPETKKLFIATKCGERLKPHLPERYNRQNFEKFIDRS